MQRSSHLFAIKRYNPFIYMTATHVLGAAWVHGVKQFYQVSQNKGVDDPILSRVPAEKWPDFLTHLQTKIADRYTEFLNGSLFYQSDIYERPPDEDFEVLRKNNVRLFDYGCKYKIKNEKGAVFFVPSLINRSYIFDIPEHKNYLKYLATQGYRPIVLSWGDIDHAEGAFRLKDYIEERLIPLFSEWRSSYPHPVFMAGYCMGGVLAMGALMRLQSQVKGLILLAVPWDFSAHKFPVRYRISKMIAHMLEHNLQDLNRIPGQLVQSLFHLLNPVSSFSKFTGVSSLTTVQQRVFVALEDWVNDYVDMTREVALECFSEWFVGNSLAERKEMSGYAIDPQQLKIPIALVIPQQDRIVPFLSAHALTSLMKPELYLTPNLGHVGVVVSRSAKQSVWKPIIKWINAQHKEKS